MTPPHLRLPSFVVHLPHRQQGLSDLSAFNAQAETFKQVIHEESIKVAGASKAPDYTFRIGGRRTFFVGAKKPAVNVAEDAGPAFQ